MTCNPIVYLVTSKSVFPVRPQTSGSLWVHQWFVLGITLEGHPSLPTLLPFSLQPSASPSLWPCLQNTSGFWARAPSVPAGLPALPSALRPWHGSCNKASVVKAASCPSVTVAYWHFAAHSPLHSWTVCLSSTVLFPMCPKGPSPGSCLILDCSFLETWHDFPHLQCFFKCYLIQSFWNPPTSVWLSLVSLCSLFY